MTLGEELSNMLPKEKVCVKVKSGITYTNNVKKVTKFMNCFMEYEVKSKTESYEPKLFHKSLIKLTTIYI